MVNQENDKVYQDLDVFTMLNMEDWEMSASYWEMFLLRLSFNFTIMVFLAKYCKHYLRMQNNLVNYVEKLSIFHWKQRTPLLMLKGIYSNWQGLLSASDSWNWNVDSAKTNGSIHSSPNNHIDHLFNPWNKIGI